ncbi:MAG: GAF domain-containing protein, partial [Flavitalea sp.]
YSFLNPVKNAGIESLVLYPLWQEAQLIGILEIGSTKSKAITTELLSKFDPIAGMFELALQKTSDYFEGQINKIIKEQFTAIQSSVEWSFTDAAVDFLMRSEKDEDARIQPIVFNNVYPLYGAIDIRNSSVERNKAIQEDLLEQLSMVETIIKMAIKIKTLPRLKQAHYFIRKSRHAVQNIMLSEEESSVNRFLQVEIVELFEFLKEKMPELTTEIDQYFTEIASPVDMLYKHRKNFDDSISFLNTMLARFVDKEQRGAQEMYPHYFERFVTDGVDFNIYIGQSISPQEEFNDFYLKNIKVWQLTLLAKAAQISKRWEEKIAVPLQTTQLILAHSYPISISFRQAERKFDVDGAYNIRYEIIKKRIDKVCIKDSNERLTQPGTVAIVYMHQQEAVEYEGYIDFLRHEGMLEGETEQLDLEELQGVSGLKAMRIKVSELKDQDKKQDKEKDKGREIEKEKAIALPKTQDFN